MTPASGITKTDGLHGSPQPGFLAPLCVRWRSRSPRTDRRITLILLAVGAILGIAFSLTRAQTDFLDEGYFMTLARNLVEHGFYSKDGIHPTAWKPPLEAAFLAPLVWALGTDAAVLAARLIGLMLYLLSAVLFASAIRKAGRPGVGLFVAAALVLSPAGIVVATSLYPQVLVGALTALGLWLAVTGQGRPRTAYALGALTGLGLLGHVTSAIPLVVIAVWSAWRSGSLRHRLSSGLITVSMTALVLMPWVVRNTLVMGKATLATGGGDNFLRGNSPNTTPSTGVMVDLTNVVPHLPRGTTEIQADALYWRIALDWMSQYPLDAVSLYFGKLLYFFAASNSFLSAVGTDRIQEIALALAWFPMLILVVLRFAQLRRHPFGPVERLSVYAVIATALGTAVFFTRVRYRVAIDPFIFLLAGAALASIVERCASSVASSRSDHVESDAPPLTERRTA